MMQIFIICFIFSNSEYWCNLLHASFALSISEMGQWCATHGRRPRGDYYCAPWTESDAESVLELELVHIEELTEGVRATIAEMRQYTPDPLMNYI